MKFKLEITLDNLAAQAQPEKELKQILEAVAGRISTRWPDDAGPVIDSKGNTVGWWEVIG